VPTGNRHVPTKQLSARVAGSRRAPARVRGAARGSECFAGALKGTLARRQCVGTNRCARHPRVRVGLPVRGAICVPSAPAQPCCRRRRRLQFGWASRRRRARRTRRRRPGSGREPPSTAAMWPASRSTMWMRSKRSPLARWDRPCLIDHPEGGSIDVAGTCQTRYTAAEQNERRRRLSAGLCSWPGPRPFLLHFRLAEHSG